MDGIKKALLISEVGWRGIRELALSLLKDNCLVDIIIKGSVAKEMLEVITSPAGLRIRAIPKWFFKIYLFFYFLWRKVTGGLQIVVTSKENTRDWALGFGLEAKLLVETKEGYQIKG